MDSVRLSDNNGKINGQLIFPTVGQNNLLLIVLLVGGAVHGFAKITCDFSDLDNYICNE
jgi:hypothetical protein